jgi:hypothetical protein
MQRNLIGNIIHQDSKALRHKGLIIKELLESLCLSVFVMMIIMRNSIYESLYYVM